MRSFEVLYELDAEGWWFAGVVEVPECHTRARTIEQAEQAAD